MTFKGLPGIIKDFLFKERQVEMRTETTIDLPDPILMEVRLAICKVLHATGLTEQVDDYLSDLKDDDGGVLVDCELHMAEWIMSLE